jgi:glycosyltransferase involved in cell wall biosynthesis
MAATPRTLFVGRGTTGVCWYRCTLPAMALGQDWVGAAGEPPALQFPTGLTAGSISFDDFASYDVLVLQQPAGVAWLEAIRDLQAQGVKVLFEIDDYVQSVRKTRSHELRNAFSKDYVRALELNMRVCDGVTVTTPYLAHRYRSLNPRVWICPNGIDLNRYDYARPAREGVTIGWAGGAGHVASMRRWLPAVADVLRARPEARFVTVGHPFALELRAEFGPERCVAIPFAELETYPASMTLFDVAIAPSGQNALFRGKSDLRWLEASALGIPLVADPEVYPEIEDGVTGIHAVEAEDAGEALLRLVDDASLRQRIGAAARAHIEAHRRIEVVAERWAAVLREVAGLEISAAA